MPIRKLSFDKIKNIFNFKAIKLEKLNKMSSSLAEPETLGFSYLNVFDEEYHEPIAEILKQSPKVQDVVSFVLQNDRKYLYQQKIKPIRLDEVELFNIEVGEVPIKPVRLIAWGEGDLDERIEDFEERIRIYNVEKER
jgi:hypothetical protein